MHRGMNRPIDTGAIYAALAGDATALGICPEFRHIRSQFSIHTFDSLPSTSTRLWEMLGVGASAGTVVIAGAQSAGRGQRGRVWQSSPGGLYLSLALAPNWPATHIAQLTCISAWGVATAFNNLGIPVRIKWPNDLFFEGKKLGGILTETKLSRSGAIAAADGLCDTFLTGSASYVRQAVIGIGVNWCNCVPETATTLRNVLASLPEVSRKNKINCLEMLAALVLKGILQGHLFHQQVGSQDFMKAYSNLLTQVGDVVSLDNDLLDLAAVGSSCADKGRVDTGQIEALKQLGKCSGEVIGVSEEGYLKVALRDIPSRSVNDLRKVSSDTLSSGSTERSPGCIADILLLKPADYLV